MLRVLRLPSAITCSLLLALTLSTAHAQDRDFRGGRGGGRFFRDGFPGGMPAAPPAQPAQPAAPNQPAATPADPNQQNNNPGTPPKPRPDRPERPANPEELKIRPDKDGKVQVNFRGQPWQDVLDWVAEVSKCSLDWQEMPGGFLNLQTQRSYTVPEVRDMINRHLLDRGYSMLQNGEVISVVNLKKVDPSMVPRVEPGELTKRQPYEFVRVSLPLDWLIAESAVDELSPMLSPNGKIKALKATNRVELMDSVANLIPVWDMVKEEQSTRGKDRLVKQFKLKHTRAGDVIDLLYGVLGMEKPSAGQEGPKNPQEAMMRQQQMMMQQQMMQQQGGAAMANRPQQTKVTLVVNPRENSILATAPPDRMEAIKNAIEIIDVPNGAGGENGIPNHIGRVQVYRMTGIEPEALVKMLQQMGTLDPTTQLEVDKKHKAIIANATPPDHAIIKALIDRLDGSGRSFEVRKLRRLQADSAAGSIEFMFGTTQKKDQSSRRRSWGWGWDGGGSTEEPKDESKEFRVEADVENNRLLLYASSVEMDQIDILLEKLGEVSPRGSNRRVRVVENLSEEEYRELLQKLQKTWKNVGPNELRVPERQPEPEKRPEQPKAKPAAPRIIPNAPAALRDQEQPAEQQPLQSREILSNKTRSPLFLAALQETVAAAQQDQPQKNQPEQAPPQKEAAPQNPPPQEERPREDRPQGRFQRREIPPINLSRDRNGNLVITSDDLEALDQIERLAEELRPARKDWKIFPLKNKSSSPTYIKWNLEDFFKAQDDSKSESDDDYMRGWYGWPQGDKKDDNTKRLSKRKKLTFIADSDTHSIMVVGGDPAQLAQVDELIALWDQPESPESKTVRITKVFQIRYSRAKVISDAIKDVYRDLLSVNDPAMQQNNRQDRNGGGSGGGGMPSITYNYGGMGRSNGTDKKRESEPPIRFKGLISLGVDEVSNSLLVSTTEGIMEGIGQMIKSLDEAARPMAPSLQVVKLNRNLDVNALQDRLNKVFGKPGANNQPQNPQNPQQNNNNPGGGRRGGNRGQPGGGQPGEAETQVENLQR